MIVGYALATVMGGTSSTGFHLAGAPALLFFLIAFAYFTVMEKTQGATLGKKLMGLKVVRENGEPMDWGASVIRW